MNFERTGIILYTIEYQACLDFYGSILDLPILFQNKNLTCFEFGASYLMVELDQDNLREQPEVERIRTCLRMNVPNVKAITDKLIAKNIAVDYQEHSWGTVAKFFDPDGNLCAFKDNTMFEQQVAAFNNSN